MSKNAQEWIARPPVAEKDFVSTLIYTDQNLFEEEIEKIKKSTWKFACHESEIPRTNDYRTLNHAGIPLIITRSSDNKIRTFINSCSHRSAFLITRVIAQPFHVRGLMRGLESAKKIAAFERFEREFGWE